MSLRATGAIPDGAMCPMTGLLEHGPALPTMQFVNEHNRRVSESGAYTSLADFLVPPYHLLSI